MADYVLCKCILLITNYITPITCCSVSRTNNSFINARLSLRRGGAGICLWSSSLYLCFIVKYYLVLNVRCVTNIYIYIYYTCIHFYSNIVIIRPPTLEDYCIYSNITYVVNVTPIGPYLVFLGNRVVNAITTNLMPRKNILYASQSREDCLRTLW